ncbi:MAG: galactokinase, partial [Bacteroidia bacterium]|nr:galactokinase [Bacteroidia bacterium]
DIPNGAGLSSSAALENSVVFGLNKLFELQLSKFDMIRISQQAEHNYVGVKCGIMDQYASMFGSQDHALLLDCRSLHAEPIKVDLGENQIILINTNVSHTLAEAAYNDRRASCERVAKQLGISALRDASENKLNSIEHQLSASDFRKAKYVIQENDRVGRAAQFLKAGLIRELGSLLFEAHAGVRDLFEVSCKELDFLVDKASENPHVLGARMMGGGFGGCTINIVQSKYLEEFKEAISSSYMKAFGKPCSIYSVALVDGVNQIDPIVLK